MTPADNEPRASAVFTVDLEPDPADIDALGHVSNLVYLRWVQDVARAHSDACGLDLSAYQRLGAVFVVRRHEIEYLRPALLGDALRISTWVADWRGASSTRRTRIERRADGVCVCRASTLWAFVDLDRGRPQRIPRELVAAFEQPLSRRP